MGRAIVFEGVEYANLAVFAREKHVPYHGLSRRLNSGMTIDEAMSTPFRDSRIVYHDVEYSSVKALCKKLGRKETTVRRRMDAGKSLEEALAEDVKTTVEYKGKRYRSVAAVCREYGRSVVTVQSRLDNGWTLERAIEEPVSENKRRTGVTVDGVEYESKVAACAAYGVPVQTVRSREQCGMAFEDALKIPHDFSTRHSLGHRESFSAVVNVGDGLFVVWCSVCGRPLLLSEKDAYEFEHSDLFCLSHTQEVLFREDVNANALRAMQLKCGSFEAAIRKYESGINLSSVVRKIRGRQHVKSVEFVCCYKFAVIECAICGRRVLLEFDDAKLFEHSARCEEYEWVV